MAGLAQDVGEVGSNEPGGSGNDNAHDPSHHAGVPGRLHQGPGELTMID
jgi:hypothetical protein